MSYQSWMRGPLCEAEGGAESGGGEPLTIASVKALLDGAFKPVSALAKRIDALEAASKARTEGEGAGGEGEGAGGEGTGGGDGKDKRSPELKRLLRTVEQLQADLTAQRAASDAATKREAETARNAALREALAGMPWVNDTAAGTAFQILQAQVRRSEDGTFVFGEDETPLKAGISGALKQHEYLFAPRAAGSSGAGGSRAPGAKAVTLEDIKPGMTAAQRQEALAVIAAATER